MFLLKYSEREGEISDSVAHPSLLGISYKCRAENENFWQDRWSNIINLTADEERKQEKNISLDLNVGKTICSVVGVGI